MPSCTLSCPLGAGVKVKRPIFSRSLGGSLITSWWGIREYFRHWTSFLICSHPGSLKNLTCFPASTSLSIKTRVLGVFNYIDMMVSNNDFLRNLLQIFMQVLINIFVCSRGIFIITKGFSDVESNRDSTSGISGTMLSRLGSISSTTKTLSSSISLRRPEMPSKLL